MPSKHHEIEITRTGKKALPPRPLPDLQVGDTVHYFSKDGRVTIEFPELSPFRTDKQQNTQVTDARTETVQSGAGSFQCGCRITLQTGEIIGWDPQENPESGGEQRVGKN